VCVGDAGLEEFHEIVKGVLEVMEGQAKRIEREKLKVCAIEFTIGATCRGNVDARTSVVTNNRRSASATASTARWRIALGRSKCWSCRSRRRRPSWNGAVTRQRLISRLSTAFTNTGFLAAASQIQPTVPVAHEDCRRAATAHGQAEQQRGLGCELAALTEPKIPTTACKTINGFSYSSLQRRVVV